MSWSPLCRLLEGKKNENSHFRPQKKSPKSSTVNGVVADQLLLEGLKLFRLNSKEYAVCICVTRNSTCCLNLDQILVKLCRQRHLSTFRKPFFAPLKKPLFLPKPKPLFETYDLLARSLPQFFNVIKRLKY